MVQGEAILSPAVSLLEKSGLVTFGGGIRQLAASTRGTQWNLMLYPKSVPLLHKREPANR